MAHRKRGENWYGQEKALLRQLISESAHIIESKCLKADFNVLKRKEWKNIQNKLNKITGKNREVSEIKLAWKRIKLAAKLNLSRNRHQQYQIGSAVKPQLSDEDHSYAVQDADFGESCSNIFSSASKIKDMPQVISVNIVEQVESDMENTSDKKTENGKKKRKKSMRDLIVESHIKFKKRSLEMLEVEHAMNIKIANMKIKKLQLEIDLLDNKKTITED